jgi:hypothetical protein
MLLPVVIRTVPHVMQIIDSRLGDQSPSRKVSSDSRVRVRAHPGIRCEFNINKKSDVINRFRGQDSAMILDKPSFDEILEVVAV